MKKASKRHFMPFRTRDDYTLHGVFHRAKAPQASVLIAGGTAIPQRFYERFAQALTEMNFNVFTFDYRGIGASKPVSLKGFNANLMHWADADISAALHKLKSLSPDLPALAFCHSFGGQTLGLSRALSSISGAIAIGSQLAWYKYWDGMERHRMWFTWQLMLPVVCRIFGYIPGYFGLKEDLPAGVGKDWAKWALSEDYFLSHVPAANDNFNAVNYPVHIVGFQDDKFAPPEAVRAFSALMPGSTTEIYDPSALGRSRIGHFGFFKKECAHLWEDYGAQLAQMARQAQ